MALLERSAYRSHWVACNSRQNWYHRNIWCVYKTKPFLSKNCATVNVISKISSNAPIFLSKQLSIDALQWFILIFRFISDRNLKVSIKSDTCVIPYAWLQEKQTEHMERVVFTQNLLLVELLLSQLEIPVNWWRLPVYSRKRKANIDKRKMIKVPKLQQVDNLIQNIASKPSCCAEDEYTYMWARTV